MPINNGEVVVEINHFKNSDVWVHPLRKALRSRFIPMRTGAHYPSWLQAAALRPNGIPGMRIHLDEKRGKIRITDALGDPENEDFYKTLNAAYEHRMGQPLGEPLRDEERSLTREDIDTWKYWLAKMVQLGVYDTTTERKRPVAELIQGHLEDYRTIQERGRVRRPVSDGKARKGEEFYTKLSESGYAEDAEFLAASAK